MSELKLLKFRGEVKKLLQELSKIYFATSPVAFRYQHRDCGATASMFSDLVRSEVNEYRAEGDEGVSVVSIYYCKHCNQLIGSLESEVKEQLLNPDYASWEKERQQRIRELKASLLKLGCKVDSKEGATFYTCPQHGGFVEISPFGEGLYEREAGWHRFHDEYIEARQDVPCECIKLATKLRAVFR